MRHYRTTTTTVNLGDITIKTTQNKTEEKKEITTTATTTKE